MRVEIINSFLKATVTVLETMAFLKPEHGKPYLKQNKLSTGDITSIVSITGKADATFAISFDTDSILLIMDKMLGLKVTGISSDVKDAIGEIANIISGSARRDLATYGIDYNGLIPTIIIGKNHEVKHIYDEPVIAIPFSFEKGKFTIELCFKD